MRRRLIHLDVPQLEHAPDYARCVGHLLDDVAAVEHSRRSREVIDLWAWMQARDPSASTPTHRDAHLSGSVTRLADCRRWSLPVQ